MSTSTPTRAVTKHPIFGFPSTLSKSVLPSEASVYKYLMYLRIEAKQLGNKVDKHLVYAKVSDEIIRIWSVFSLPTITASGIIFRIKAIDNKINDLMRSWGRTKDNEKTKIAEQFEVMFDVCSCRCYDKGLDRKDCQCPVKIPLIEWDGYVQQKLRIGQLGSVDRENSRKLQRNAHDRIKERISNERSHEESSCSLSQDNVTSPRKIPARSDTASVDSTKLYNTHQYNNVALIADRYNLSDYAVASICNALLKDLKILTNDNKLDRMKISRERDRARKMNIAKLDECSKNLICIGFDGRRDQTKHIETLMSEDGSKSKSVTRCIMEEHISCTIEPSGKYLNHFSPKTSRAKDISEELVTLIQDNGSSKSITSLLCDGCAVNTGVNGGIIRRLELYLCRPLQWLICLLHCNELPFKDIFKYLDGITQGPGSYSGPIGKKIVGDVHKMPIVKYEAIPGLLKTYTDACIKSLSSDQKYLYFICHAVQDGVLPKDTTLLSRSPGMMHEARWLTKANRIMRLYISEANPTKSLQRLAFFIVSYYAPVWFQIKSNSSLTHGAKNFFFMIEKSRQFPEDEKNIIQKALSRNAYFAHVEHVLTSALADNDQKVRSFAVKKILEREPIPDDRQEIRRFVMPKVNFQSKHYMDLVNWNSSDIYIPPVIQFLAVNEIKSIVEAPYRFPDIPCHSQSVERCVKLVSEASSQVADYEKRHGFILNTLKSRNEMPSILSKKDFN